METETLTALQSILSSLIEIFYPFLQISSSIATIAVFLKYLIILLTILVGIAVIFLIRKILIAVFNFAAELWKKFRRR